MKLSDQQKEQIRLKFSLMQSKEEFLQLLNEVLFMLYPITAKRISLKYLNYYAYGKSKAAKCYRSFEIPKKTKGEMRTIHAPIKGLKNVQKVISLILSVIHIPRREATGFTEGVSIVDNARRHLAKQYVWNIDLKNFFPSVSEARVAFVLKTQPFNLGNNTERMALAHFISKLCCVKPIVDLNEVDETVIKPCLPQGAPTSPILTNIICRNMDRLLKDLAKRNKLAYSRYADDITFSGNYNLFKKTDDFPKQVREIIAQEGFTINEKKVRLQNAAYRQEVTGIIVNNRLNVPKEYAKNLRTWFHWLETYGLEGAKFKYAMHNPKASSFKEILIGKVLYFSMVRKNETPLVSKYIKLLNKHFSTTLNEFKVENVNHENSKYNQSSKAITLNEVVELLLRNPDNPDIDSAYQLFQQIIK